MNETLLHEEINSSLKEMNEGLAGELGSEEYKEATNATTKLIDKVIDLKKLKIDEEQRKLDRESNERVALEKIRAEEREKKRQLCADVATWGIGLGVTSAFALVIAKFEETGTIHTKVGQIVLNRLFKRN